MQGLRNFPYSSHAPAWEFIRQRSSVAFGFRVTSGIPTPERGNNVVGGYFLRVTLKLHILVTGFRHPCRNDGQHKRLKVIMGIADTLRPVLPTVNG